MALGLKEIPDSRVYLGPSMTMVSYVAAPGTSDYVSGGYTITAAQLGLGHIISGSVMGQNAAAQGFVGSIIIAQTATPLASVTSCLFQISAIYLPNNATTTTSVNVNGGVLTNNSGGALLLALPDLPASDNLTGLTFILEFKGY